MGGMSPPRLGMMESSQRLYGGRLWDLAEKVEGAGILLYFHLRGMAWHLPHQPALSVC